MRATRVDYPFVEECVTFELAEHDVQPVMLPIVHEPANGPRWIAWSLVLAGLVLLGVLLSGCQSPQMQALESAAHGVLVSADTLVVAAQADPSTVATLGDRLQALASSSPTAAATISLVVSHITAGNLAIAHAILQAAIQDTAPVSVAASVAGP